MNLTKRLLILEKVKARKAVDNNSFITNVEIETVGMNEEREIIVTGRHHYFVEDLKHV